MSLRFLACIALALALLALATSTLAGPSDAACALGALANLAVSGFLFSRALPRVAAVVVGALVGAGWNYTMSRLATWRQ